MSRYTGVGVPLRAKKEYLLERVRQEGFSDVDGFIRANLHYLPGTKRKLFYSITDDQHRYQAKEFRELYSQTPYYGRG
ncbi:hypothetical protein KAR91_62355 [Candidatus Pacearchaeota archaeon]|nr:hypothetical protein [Candidatus Pacearchaeota archaeon]